MSIASWPSNERPREKLILKGAQALSDAELIAIFLRTGTNGKTAIDLARQVLGQFQDLRTLVDAGQAEFCSIKGLGMAKFVQIQAAIELGRRYLETALQHGDVLNNPVQTRKYLTARLRSYSHEVFACLFLDNRHRIISFDEMFNGTIDGAHVHPREVVRSALTYNAAAVIFSHNHPSGVAEPSQADQALTRRLQDALALVDIRVLDHIVIGEGETVSFAERGLL
jgi:DNA repair protein RadC